MDSTSRGVIAGILAATTLAVWILLVDLSRGMPGSTPAHLAGALFGTGPAGTAGIAGYTALHYAVFIVLGMAMARVPGGFARATWIPFGVILGFLLFGLVFYGSLIVTGAGALATLGWPALFAGNLLAGLVMVAWLHARHPQRSGNWRDLLRRDRLLVEGAITGLIGAATVAIFFLLVDGLAGRVLFTPAALGSAFFLGAASAAEVRVSALTVGGFTLLHLAAFAAIGMVAATLVQGIERYPRAIVGAALLVVTFTVFSIGLLAIAAVWILDTLGWWTVGLGNLLAAAAMGSYLWRVHPALSRALDQPEQPGEPAPGGTAAP
jgi:hypothetical protein